MKKEVFIIGAMGLLTTSLIAISVFGVFYFSHPNSIVLATIQRSAFFEFQIANGNLDAHLDTSGMPDG